MSLTCPSDAVSRNRGESNLYLPQLKCNYLEDLVEKKETRRKRVSLHPQPRAQAVTQGFRERGRAPSPRFPAGPSQRGAAPRRPEPPRRGVCTAAGPSAPLCRACTQERSNREKVMLDLSAHSVLGGHQRYRTTLNGGNAMRGAARA